MREWPFVNAFDMPPLRPGSLFIVRQLRICSPTLQYLLGRGHRYPVLYLVSADGRACWRQGIEPTAETTTKAQLSLGRRFCGERRA